ncbi:unnamed protein product [Heterobilharzia americana]|nr:unnamed protein product [Heterobilharzia americana]
MPAETALPENLVKLKFNEKAEVKQVAEKKSPSMNSECLCEVPTNASEAEILADKNSAKQNENENDDIHFIKSDSLDESPEKRSPIKSQNPLVKSLLKPKASISLPSKDSTYSFDKYSPHTLLNTGFNATEEESYRENIPSSYSNSVNPKNKLLMNRLSLPITTRDIVNKAEKVTLAVHEPNSLNATNVKNTSVTQFVTANVAYTVTEPRTVQPVISQIGRIPGTTITTGKVFNSSNYGVHGSNISTHTSQQLVFQMHRTSDMILDSNQQLLDTQRCSVINPNNSVFVSEHSPSAVTRLCSNQASNFTNKLQQPIRSTIDNMTGVMRQQHTLTPSVLSVQSLHPTSSQRFRNPQPSVISTNETSRPISLSHVSGPKVIKTAISASNVGSTHPPNLFCSSMINITSDGLPIVDQTNRTSVVPQNTLVSSSSLGQFPPSISTNNVIVLHRGVARKTFTSTPSIRIGPNAPVYTQTILSGNYSNASAAFPGRQLRIIGLPNSPVVCSASTTETQVFLQESNAVIRSINETVNNSNTNIIPSSHLLHTSRLGTILEVDLDSENYDEQSNNTDYSNSDTSVKNSQNIPIISNSSLSSFDSPRITTLHKSTISTSDETAVNQFRNSSNHELYDTTGLCTKMNEQPSNNITSLNIIGANKEDRLSSYSDDSIVHKREQLVEITSTDSSQQCIELDSWNLNINSKSSEHFSDNTTSNVFNNPPDAKRPRFELSVASVESSN